MKKKIVIFHIRKRLRLLTCNVIAMVTSFVLNSTVQDNVIRRNVISTDCFFLVILIGRATFGGPIAITVYLNYRLPSEAQCL